MLAGSKLIHDKSHALRSIHGIVEHAQALVGNKDIRTIGVVDDSLAPYNQAYQLQTASRHLHALKQPKKRLVSENVPSRYTIRQSVNG